MRPWKKLILWIAAGVAVLPLTLIITLVLWPFWGWFEAVSGIESLGHSGPADWCFVAVYLMVAAAIMAGRQWMRKKAASRSAGGRPP